MNTAKHLSYWLLTGGVLIIAAFLLLSRDTVPASADDKLGHIEKWEYGYLHNLRYLPDNVNLVGWVTDEGEISANSMEELYGKIGGSGKIASLGSGLKVYNVLGSQGWEFANKEEESVKPGHLSSSVLFKRRIK